MFSLLLWLLARGRGRLEVDGDGARELRTAGWVLSD